MDTILVNFLGAASAGKSVLAADCYVTANKKGYKSYLVTEYVKTWALQGFPINEYRQMTILGQQIQSEECAYGQYKFLFSESPLELVGFYSDYYSQHKLDPIDTIRQVRYNAIKYRNLKIVNLFLHIKPEWYDQTGRYETLEQALEREQKMKEYFIKRDIPFIELNHREPEKILEMLTF